MDRDVHRIHAWIQAVYQDRRFHGEPPGGYARGAAAAAGGSSTASEVRRQTGLRWPCRGRGCCHCARPVSHAVASSWVRWPVTECPRAAGAAAPCCPRRLQGREVVVRPLSEVLGSDTPKLKVQGSGNLERTVSAVSSSAGCAAAAADLAPAAAAGILLAPGHCPKAAMPACVCFMGRVPAAALAACSPWSASMPAGPAPHPPRQPTAAAAAQQPGGSTWWMSPPPSLPSQRHLAQRLQQEQQRRPGTLSATPARRHQQRAAARELQQRQQRRQAKGAPPAPPRLRLGKPRGPSLATLLPLQPRSSSSLQPRQQPQPHLLRLAGRHLGMGHPSLLQHLQLRPPPPQQQPRLPAAAAPASLRHASRCGVPAGQKCPW